MPNRDNAYRYRMSLLRRISDLEIEIQVERDHKLDAHQRHWREIEIHIEVLERQLSNLLIAYDWARNDDSIDK